MLLLLIGAVFVKEAEHWQREHAQVIAGEVQLSECREAVQPREVQAANENEHQRSQ